MGRQGETWVGQERRGEAGRDVGRLEEVVGGVCKADPYNRCVL